MKKTRHIAIFAVALLMMTQVFAGCAANTDTIGHVQPEDGVQDDAKPVDNQSKDGDTASISSDEDDSSFVDFRDVLNEALGVEVKIMLDEYDAQEGTIKTGENAGIMLSGIYAEQQEWKIDIEDESILELVAHGPEKDVVGERQGFDFFAIKGLKAGTAKVTITDTIKESGEEGMTYTFEITVK